MVADNIDDEQVEPDESDEENKQVHIGVVDNLENGENEIDIAKPETYESRTSQE